MSISSKQADMIIKAAKPLSDYMSDEKFAILNSGHFTGRFNRNNLMLRFFPTAENEYNTSRAIAQGFEGYGITMDMVQELREKNAVLDGMVNGDGSVLVKIDPKKIRESAGSAVEKYAGKNDARMSARGA